MISEALLLALTGVTTNLIQEATETTLLVNHLAIMVEEEEGSGMTIEGMVEVSEAEEEAEVIEAIEVIEAEATVSGDFADEVEEVKTCLAPIYLHPCYFKDY